MTNNRTTTTRKASITGVVQGCGFRPFVYREAVKRELRGWVKNTSSGVDILASGAEEQLDTFFAALRASAPAAACVNDVIISVVHNHGELDGFSISKSSSDGPKRVVITPDIATCPDCLAEISDPQNRRHRYPFTNCTSCGPRYSIMRTLPYDRERTTMNTFRMCPECRKEFDEPSDRRFHAQPNACPVCGPQLALWDKTGHTLAVKDDALREAAQRLKNGDIIAVKGLGGFHLMADAANDNAVRTLRERKHREEKPFAVMMPDIKTARQYARVSVLEEEWMTSPAAPIVLVKKGQEGSLVPPLSMSIAPSNPWIGIFLPYTPLHHLLMQEVGTPLIATSGNLCDEPICIDEHEALERLGEIADFFLIHNRPIAHPVDDSVMRISTGRPLFIRCARGLAPMTLNIKNAGPEKVVLGAGAHMKSTFAIGRGRQVVVSPHIGDLETIPAWQSYEQNLETLQELYETRPESAVHDKHPDYATSRYCDWHFKNNQTVQHHYAHILAVMAEHGLSGPVLGIAWDGTGYGDDGTVWGGEVLKADTNKYDRIIHLRPFLLPGGDAAAREPRRSALGVLYEMHRDAAGSVASAMTHSGFEPNESIILLQAIAQRVNTVTTTSMGRLFDAVASLLGICHVSSYEGQAAMLLQAKAEEIDHDGSAYNIAVRDNLDWEPIICGIMEDCAKDVDTSMIAARFHQSLVNMIIAVSDAHPDLPVALGGGCFQNTWLLEHSVVALREKNRDVYWPIRLPPNDGAIAFGQVVAACGRNHS